MLTLGIFDSGIGGLSVLSHLVKSNLPIKYYYFADSLYMPYGSLSDKKVLERSIAVCNWLMDKGADMILVACNTATAIAIDTLRKKYPEILFVGIEPGIKPATKVSKNNSVAVLATPKTVESTRFQKLISTLNSNNKYVITTRKGHGLVEMVENSTFSQTKNIHLLEEHLNSVVQENTDVLVLGCTHYSFLIPFIKNWLKKTGKDISVIDTSKAVAQYTKQLLLNHSLNKNSEEVAQLCFATSGDNNAFAKAIKYSNIDNKKVIESCKF